MHLWQEGPLSFRSLLRWLWRPRRRVENSRAVLWHSAREVLQALPGFWGVWPSPVTAKFCSSSMLRPHRPLLLTWLRSNGTTFSSAGEGFDNKAKLTLRKSCEFRATPLKSPCMTSLALHPGQTLPTRSADEARMKKPIFLLLLLVMSFGLAPEAFSENTEQWEVVLDDGQGSADFTLIEEQDGTVTADGNWTNTSQGFESFGSFTDAPVTIAGFSISITASGQATSPSAPPPFRFSGFTLSIGGTANNGLGKGAYRIEFQGQGWPSFIAGWWGGMRTSGGGITPQSAGMPSEAMPWIPLLLLDD